MLVVPMYDWTRQPKIDWSCWNSVNVTNLKQLNLCSKSPWVLHEVESNCLACCKSWNNWNNASKHRPVLLPWQFHCCLANYPWQPHVHAMASLTWLTLPEFCIKRCFSRKLSGKHLASNHDTATFEIPMAKHAPTSPCCSWSTTLTKYRCISGS